MKPRILIVDDSITVRMDLKDPLEKAGFEAVLCATLATARQALINDAAQAVILDVVLPDGDGLDFLREMKSSSVWKNIPVMLLSSEDEVRDRIRGLQTGADEYVGKPYDASQVASRARELIKGPSPKTRDRARILVIDDSLTYRQELKAALEGTGYEAMTAASGEEGLRCAEELRPDALIVDRMLPGLDGLSVIQKVRLDAALRRMPCLLLTASEDRQDELQALEAGADTYVQKRQAMGVILAKLAALLRSGRVAPDDQAAGLLSPKRVLAVDDSVTYLNELSDQLRQESYDVVLARSGQEALEFLAVQPVDAILLDLLMPGLSGHQTCQKIKENPTWRDIPLIMLTAMEEREAMLEGINAGADDYITKSSEFNVLKARLKAQLRRRQFEDENRRIQEQLRRQEVEAIEMQAVKELANARAKHIMDLEKKNEELKRAREAADQAAKELESFSYSVSHDLRAPLRHISGFADLVQSDATTSMSESGRRFMALIVSSVQQMGQLIDDLLAFSRTSRTELKKEKVLLEPLIRAVLSELAADQQGRQVEWKVNPLPEVVGDSRLLKQVLVNLLSNALKYSRHCATALIEVGFEKSPDGQTVIFVRDNGAGFDMRHADKLFGVFQRLHSAEEFEGTGIGLANVRRIIERHGGRTWAQGAVDQGATFYFSLPGR